MVLQYTLTQEHSSIVAKLSEGNFGNVDFVIKPALEIGLRQLEMDEPEDDLRFPSKNPGKVSD